ncbi:MAG: efflux RND transporter periplasmic adaptor subunit [Bacteroides sp.]|nr:efflux RND transporter periplasmic adaptor subunit [Bacteroides sp.]MCM1379629.1 efflux RND transporter periplasmic adaptor subunit [Bacteroides sp.]MCM1445989.1 efflux RND transporter periplasmic adaptor subunit [Prevotella sp.]
MKKLPLILACLAMTACGHKHHTEVAEEEAHHHDSDLIELSDSQAARFGVVVDTVCPGDFSTLIPASGIVERSSADAATASAPIAGIVKFAKGINVGSRVAKGTLLAVIDPTAVSGGDGNRAAKAAMDAARREVERLTPLYNDRLVTAAEYNAALAAYDEAKAAYAPSAGNGHVISPISGQITALQVQNSAYVQPGQAIAAVSLDDALTLHAEVSPELYGSLRSVNDARIGDFTLSEHSGKISGISAENGYACIFFTFNNDGQIAPGAAVGVKLLGGARPNVISLPLGAISEQQGEYFVYLRHSPGHYEKQRVTLGENDGRRVEITSGLSGGEAVVTAGATTVRLAESSTSIPEGHSHHH